MLVLTRKLDEKIRIGDNISITGVGVKDNGGVKLGIDAPKNIPVHRQEVYDAIHKDEKSPKK